MAKISGLGGTIIVQDSGAVNRTITNDCTNFSWSTPRGTQDTTGVDKSAHETLLLLADYTVTLNGVFNSAANLSHAVFSTVSSTTVVRAVSIAPTSNSSTPILVVNCVLTDYQITRANTG